MRLHPAFVLVGHKDNSRSPSGMTSKKINGKKQNRSLRDDRQERQQQWQMQGFFAALRMTTNDES
jgi:hypothetical protein